MSDATRVRTDEATATASDRRPSITAVVLAGGGSERFGDRPKATATLGGRPLLSHVISELDSTSDGRLVVAVGDRAKRAIVEPTLAESARYCYDVSWSDGPLAGIAGALPAVDTDAVVLCGCDMPLVDSTAIRWLTHELDGDVDAVVPVVDGARQPLHAVYDCAALRGYCRREPMDDRLTALLDSLRVRTVTPTEASTGVPLTQSVTNVNTRGELATLEQAAD